MLKPQQVDDADFVSRSIFEPLMSWDEQRVIFNKIFEFPDGVPESVIWRKIVKQDGAVHQMGKNAEAAKRSRGSNASYIGFSSATSQAVRQIKLLANDGHGFDVVHAPDEGAYHAHIQYKFANGLTYGQIGKSRRQELKFVLSKLFNDLVRAQ